MHLFLNGGGSREKTVITNQKLDEVINHNKPALYVPLAMDPTKNPYDKCLDWVKRELSQVSIPDIEMVETFEELANRNYHNYSFIFIGGGNTYKLLKGLKESGSFTKLKDYLEDDGVIIGGSAGAIIFGYDINSCRSMDKNEVNLESTSGFNVLDGISIFAHYTNHSYKYTEEENELIQEKYTIDLEDYSIQYGIVIALPEEDTIYVNNDGYEIIGSLPYYVFENGNITKHEIEKDNTKRKE